MFFKMLFNDDFISRSLKCRMKPEDGGHCKTLSGEFLWHLCSDEMNESGTGFIEPGLLDCHAV